MKIVISGMSGFVGLKLKAFFQEKGHAVVGLSVRDDTSIPSIVEVLEGSDILINLSGQSIFGYWSKAYKKTLYDSRINTTKNIEFVPFYLQVLFLLIL